MTWLIYQLWTFVAVRVERKLADLKIQRREHSSSPLETDSVQWF